MAPVIISALCRYEHFRQTVESLERCVLAESTPVVVALDYPSKPEHREGYEKIVNYLDELQGNHGFKSMTVLKRERNYGIGLHGNINTAIDEVLEDYDSFIFTEDDNVFAPNFLVFLNEGLRRFRDDSSVFALNAYRHFYNVTYKSNTFFRQDVDFSGWGYAMWKDRWEDVRRLSQEWFRERFSFRNLMKMKLQHGNNRMLDFVGICNTQNFDLVDNTLSVYMALANKHVVMPVVSLVRNLGWDGSGENCKSNEASIASAHLSQPISTAKDFEFVGSGYECFNENQKVYIKESYGRVSNLTLIKMLVRKIIKKIN